MTPLTRLALAALIGYQRCVSPLFGRHCRFAPSCSEYARLALGDHGLIRGAALTVRRILKCHPFHPGGLDPPPAPERRG